MPQYRILGFTKGLDLAVKRHAPVQQQVGLLQAMSRARTCSWHGGSQGQPREQESPKRAEEDEGREEDRLHRAWNARPKGLCEPLQTPEEASSNDRRGTRESILGKMCRGTGERRDGGLKGGYCGFSSMTSD